MAVSKNYGDYLVAMEKDIRPSSSYNATSTTATGFMEFKPRDMVTQKRFDAMSPAWEGVDSSMKAVEQGLYSLDAAEKNRQELRNKSIPVDTTRPIVPTVKVSYSTQ